MTAERVTADLDGILPAGEHGFHLHENPDCKDGGAAASGHYGPENTGVHTGPYGNDHLGALPRLESDGGRVTAPGVAPRLTMGDGFGQALVMHEGPRQLLRSGGAERRRPADGVRGHRHSDPRDARWRPREADGACARDPGGQHVGGLVPNETIALQAELDGQRSDIATIRVGPGMDQNGIVLRMP